MWKCILLSIKKSQKKWKNGNSWAISRLICVLFKPTVFTLSVLLISRLLEICGQNVTAVLLRFPANKEKNEQTKFQNEFQRLKIRKDYVRWKKNVCSEYNTDFFFALLMAVF